MTEYQDFLIADFKEGKRADREPWLLPNDAFTNLENVFLRRGIIHKRYGYSVFGRMGTFVSGETGFANPSGNRYTLAATAQDPVIEGSVRVYDDGGTQEIFDDGDETLSGDGTGTVNYTTGALDVTFTGAVVGTVTVDYHYSDTGTDRNIRGIFNLENEISEDVCIACDRDNLSVWNTSYGYFENKPLAVAGTYSYFGNKAALMWGKSFQWKQFLCDGTGDYSSGIWTYNPDIGTDGEVYQRKFSISGTTVSAESFDTGDGGKTYGKTLAAPPVVEGSIDITDAISQESFTDDGSGNLTGSAGGSGTINYETGVCAIAYNANLAGGRAIAIDYLTRDVSCDYCSMIHPYYRHLVCLSTKETSDNGSTYVLHNQRLRWGKINSDTKFLSDVGGQGSSLDAATNESIVSSGIVKGILVVAFERSIWVVDYTGNSSIPYRWRRLEGNLEINSVFGTIVTEDLVVFVGHGAIYGCDGTRVKRIDEKLPDFTDDDISLDYLNNCCAFYDKKLDQGLLCYTSIAGETTNDNTLVFGFKDGWFSTYTFGMYCLGNYIRTSGTTWADLYARCPTWDSPDILGKMWKEIYNQSKEDIVLGGSSKGYVYIVNDTSKGADEVEGTDEYYNYSIKSKRYTPFVSAGQKVLFGYLDILVDKTAAAQAYVNLFSGENPGSYASKLLTMQSESGDNKIWKRINVNHDANAHGFELTMDGSQMADSDIAGSGFRIHAFNLKMRPSGKIILR